MSEPADDGIVPVMPPMPVLVEDLAKLGLRQSVLDLQAAVDRLSHEVAELAERLQELDDR